MFRDTEETPCGNGRKDDAPTTRGRLAGAQRGCYDIDVPAKPPRAWIHAAVACAAAVGLRAGSPAVAEADPSRLDRRTFQQALDRLLDRYLEPVDEGRVLARALAGAAGALDPYTEFVPAEVRARLERGVDPREWGLFASWTGDRGALAVDHVVPGSAAERAGLAEGDLIVAANGLEFDRSTGRTAAFAALAGEANALLRLTVRRPGRTELAAVVRVERESGHTVTARLQATPGGPVAVVRIGGFRAGTAAAVRRSLVRLRARAGRDLAGIVFDLRGNPGGLVDEALILADDFVGSGVLARLRGRGGRILREDRAHAPNSDTVTPLAVVLDRRSASAAELFAAALRDHGRARIVGERSFGKGTVQEIYGLPDGSALSMTIARYTSPNDHVIDGVGLAPDVWVREGDEPVEAAITAVTEGARRDGGNRDGLTSRSR